MQNVVWKCRSLTIFPEFLFRNPYGSDRTENPKTRTNIAYLLMDYWEIIGTREKIHQITTNKCKELIWNTFRNISISDQKMHAGLILGISKLL